MKPLKLINPKLDELHFYKFINMFVGKNYALSTGRIHLSTLCCKETNDIFKYIMIYRLSSLDSRFGTWGVGVRLKYMPVGVGVRNP